MRGLSDKAHHGVMDVYWPKWTDGWKSVHQSVFKFLFVAWFSYFMKIKKKNCVSPVVRKKKILNCSEIWCCGEVSWELMWTLHPTRRLEVLPFFRSVPQESVPHEKGTMSVQAIRSSKCRLGKIEITFWSWSSNFTQAGSIGRTFSNYSSWIWTSEKYRNSWTQLQLYYPPSEVWVRPWRFFGKLPTVLKFGIKVLIGHFLEVMSTDRSSAWLW